MAQSKLSQQIFDLLVDIEKKDTSGPYEKDKHYENVMDTESEITEILSNHFEDLSEEKIDEVTKKIMHIYLWESYSLINKVDGIEKISKIISSL